jgi:hypothetical protein
MKELGVLIDGLNALTGQAPSDEEQMLIYRLLFRLKKQLIEQPLTAEEAAGG